ncbi:hypothetical protein AB0L65_07865 [Nonomuraea sp. NPDC052116]|uniref:hypothetical protein n=1 Tax=Nonomuraea sp. NPDC052116 TaxID=3155665 RepID=UPI00341A6C04
MPSGTGPLGRGNNYDQRLWRTSLYQAFPGYRGGRHALHRQLDFLRVLRNKIAHHCPIHHRHLQADQDTILQPKRASASSRVPHMVNVPYNP